MSLQRTLSILAVSLGFVSACADEGPTAPASTPAVAQIVSPLTRTYFIAADEVIWDYAPSGINQIFNRPFEGEELVFTARGDDRIGTAYKKAMYREYTDASFTTLKAIPPEWAHLGMMGPLIRAVVDDTLKIVLKNNLPFAVSLHPHGFFYLKDSEGTPYDDGTSGGDKKDDAVPPGGTHTYTWVALERSGPGPADGSTAFWMYHSHVDEVVDVYTGLAGPIIITARAAAREDGSSKDFDREIITNFEVFDENSSHFLDYNIATFTGKPQKVRLDDEEFVESNLMHAINGYVYGNLPLDAMVLTKGEKVRWYLMGMGTEVDLHTAHWHGMTVLHRGARTDVVELLPASMGMVDLEPDNVGTWLFHCHVADHIAAGMVVRFQVVP